MSEWRTSKKKSAGKKSAGKKKASSRKKSSATPGSGHETSDDQEGSGKKKAASRKSSAKKSSGKKTSGEKPSAEKTGEKSSGKKATSKEASGKEASSKEASSKEAAAEQGASKEASGKEASGKKASSKEAAAEKGASKKASGKKASGKKASGKEASGKEASGKKASSKKASGKEASGKKASGKKASGKKASGKKASGKKASKSSSTTKTDRRLTAVGSPASPDDPGARPDGALWLVPTPAEPLPSNVLPLFPDFVPDHEWVMGLLTGTESEIDGSAVIFLEAGTKDVVYLEVLDVLDAAAIVAAVHNALARLDRTRRTPPTRIRVASPTYVELLHQGGLEGITLIVGPTPELDGLRKELHGYELPGIEPQHDRYRGTPDVDDDRLMFFVEAAVSFRRARPWEAISIDVPLVFMLPELGIEQGVVSIMGMGAEGGLMVIPDVAAVPDGETIELRGMGSMPPQSLAVVFVKRSELSPARKGELEVMPAAPRRGPFPVLLAVDAEQRSRPVTRDDYDVAIAAMLAVDAFVSDYSPVLQCTSLRSLLACYPMSLGERARVDVHLGIPDGVWEAEEDDEQPSVELVMDPAPRIEPQLTCRLRISLHGIKPPIWRRVEVSSTISLGALHRVIQAAMGWEDEHLHEFIVGHDRFGPPSDDSFDREVHDEGAVTLGDVGAKGLVFDYLYDFGDHWLHRIRIEEVYEPAEPLARPRCTGGRRACPPEDCGGIPGYTQAVEHLAGSSEADLPEPWKDFFEGFDPEAFDRVAIDAELERVFTEE